MMVTGTMSPQALLLLTAAEESQPALPQAGEKHTQASRYQVLQVIYEPGSTPHLKNCDPRHRA